MENDKTTKLIENDINSNPNTNKNTNSNTNSANKAKLNPNYNLNKCINKSQNENSTLLINKNQENENLEKKRQDKEKSMEESRIVVEEYFSKLIKSEQKFKIFQIIGYSALLIFLCLLLLKSILKNNGQDSISYYIILVPVLLTILSFIISYNFFLYMKQLIEMDETQLFKKGTPENSKNNNNLSNIISYLALNLLGILIMIYFILLAIKLETRALEKSLTLNGINTSFYISLIIGFFYFIYIFPALIHNKMYWEILLIISFIINFFIFLILSSMKFDMMKNIKNTEWFVPLYILLSLLFIYSIFDLICGKTLPIFRVFFSISVLLFLIGTVFISIYLDLKNDDKNYSRIYVGLIIYLSAYLIFIIEKISIFIFGINTEQDNDSQIENEEKQKL